jgi:hypothetical protein
MMTARCGSLPPTTDRREKRTRPPHRTTINASTRQHRDVSGKPAIGLGVVTSAEVPILRTV